MKCSQAASSKLVEVSAEFVTATVAGMTDEAERIENGEQEVSHIVLKGEVLITMVSLNQQLSPPPGHFTVLMRTTRQRAGLLFCPGWCH